MQMIITYHTQIFFCIIAFGWSSCYLQLIILSV